MRLHTQLRKQHSRTRLPNRDHVTLRIDRGKPSAHLVRREHFVSQTMPLRAAPRTRNDNALWRSNHQPAGLNQKLLRRNLLQFSPQFVSALHQRDIKWMLEVGFADD